MNLFLVLIIGLLTTTSTLANSEVTSINDSNLASFNYLAMGSFVKSLQAINSLPPRDASASQIESGSDAISQDTIEIFQRIQNFAFNKSLINLKPCSDCYGFADYAAKTIYIQPSFVQLLLQQYGKAEGLRLVEFMIAHEISHFIHELSIGHGVKPYLSINGNHSLFVHDTTSDNSAEGGRRSHAEIDSYAFIIMKNSGGTSPLITIRHWFAETIEEVKKSGNSDDLDVVLKDLGNRLNSSELVINNLWQN